MSYENQLLFYKETLKHRNKTHVSTTKWQNFLCSLLQRASMRRAVELHPLWFKSIPFCNTPFFSFILLGGEGEGKSREWHTMNILIICFSFFFFPIAFHSNEMSLSFTELFLAQ